MFAFGQRHCLLCLCVKFLRPVGQWTNQLRLRTLLLFLPPAVICVYPNRIEPTLGPLPFWSWRGAFALRRTLNFGFRSQRRLFAPESMLCLMHVRVYCIVPDPAPVSATPHCHSHRNPAPTHCVTPLIWLPPCPVAFHCRIVL